MDAEPRFRYEASRGMHALLFLAAACSLAQPPTPPAEEAEPTSLLPVLIASAGMSAVVLGVGTQAWWDEGLQPFSFRDTGWFGRDTYSGGADKLGHLYSSYVMTQAAASIYEAIGVESETAAWLSAGFVFLLFNGFELIDGFTDFGFEYGDVVFNTLGVASGLVARLFPELERSLGIRLGYIPSNDFLDNPKSVLKFINDYSGMLYYLDFKAQGILEQLELEPGWARYLVGGLIYGTQGYSPVRQAPDEKRRLFGVHLGISAAELLRENAEGDGPTLGIARALDFYALPFFSVSLMRDLNGSDWIFSLGLGHRAQVAF